MRRKTGQRTLMRRQVNTPSFTQSRSEAMNNFLRDRHDQEVTVALEVTAASADKNQIKTSFKHDSETGRMCVAQGMPANGIIPGCVGAGNRAPWADLSAVAYALDPDDAGKANVAMEEVRFIQGQTATADKRRDSKRSNNFDVHGARGSGTQWHCG
jgi:hypothetical protein